MNNQILVYTSVVGFFSVISFSIFKINKWYKEYLKELDTINKSAFIINKDHKAEVMITHISEDDIELKKYIKKRLENLFLITDNLETDLETDLDNFLENENNENNVPETLKKGHHDKIHVEYNINNNSYSMFITGEIVEKDNFTKPDTKLKRKIITAHLINADEEIIDVKKLLEEFQGPCLDFYDSIDGISTSWNDVLYPYDLKDWENLIIGDLFGTETIINFVKDFNDKIEWNPNLIKIFFYSRILKDIVL